jgi:hypothetical protein
MNVYVVLFLFNNVIYVFLLHDCLCMTTLTEVFPCFFLRCKANARVMSLKMGHGLHSSYFLLFYIFFFCVVLCDVCFATFPVLFVCICVLNNCHRVATQLQLNKYIKCDIS